MPRGTCPNCSNTYALEPRFCGRRCKCNSCGHVFTVPDEASVRNDAITDESDEVGTPSPKRIVQNARSVGEGEEESSSRKTGDDTDDVLLGKGRCPSCLKTFTADPRFFGKRVQCDSCRFVFAIPKPSETDIYKSDAEVELASSSVPPEPAAHDEDVLHEAGAKPYTDSFKDSGHHHAPKSSSHGRKVLALLAVLAGAAAIWWYSAGDSGTLSSDGNAVARTGTTLLAQPLSRSSGQSRYSNADAERDIAAERRAYVLKHASALEADRRQQAASQRTEQQRSQTRLTTLQSEARSLESKLRLGSFSKPSAPLVMSDSYLSRQLASDFIEKHRDWGEERRALLGELFAIQDELALLSDRISHLSLLSALRTDISTHAFAKPTEPFISSLNDADVRRIKRSLYAVQLEQWLAEAELLEARQATLSAASRSRVQQLQTPSGPDATITGGPWHFERCVDGDTIEITIGRNGPKEKVRLLNIDTPEAGETGFYQATSALKKLLEYRTIELEFERPGEPTRDRYGRLLAFVFVNDRLINYEMVRLGWSDFYTDYGRGRYALPLEYAESDARANRRGLHR